MGLETYTDGAYRTFTELVADALTGKEGYLVELDAATGKVQLLDAGVAIGVMHCKLEGGNDVSIRLLGKGGTVKVVAGGVIAGGARVKGASGGKVVTNGGYGRGLGVKLTTGNSANNDVIEVLDVVEPIITAQAAPALTSTNGTAAAAADLAALKAESELIGDDVRALHAKLVSAGVIY